MSLPSLIDLDTYRAETMRALLNEEGQRCIWHYDIVPTRDAFSRAVEDCDYDNIQRNGDALKDGKPYALIGGGICDHPFGTVEELTSILRWLCLEGYLSCYRRSDGDTTPTDTATV